MGVTTTYSEKIDQAKAALGEATKLILEIVGDVDMHGASHLTTENRLRLVAYTGKLIEMQGAL